MRFALVNLLLYPFQVADIAFRIEKVGTWRQNSLEKVAGYCKNSLEKVAAIGYAKDIDRTKRRNRHVEKKN